MRNSSEQNDTKPGSQEFEEIRLSHTSDEPEILDAVLGVSRSATETYFTLLRNQPTPVGPLITLLNRSETGVRDDLSALEDDGLVTEDRRVAEEGRHYTYHALPLEDLKSMLNECIDVFDIHVDSRIDELRESPDGEPLMMRSTASDSSSSSLSLSPVEMTNDSQHPLDGKSISLRSIATAVFGMDKPVLVTYLILLDHPRSTAAELAEIQNLVRGTASIRLNELQKLGLAHPAARYTGGSPAYEYVPRPFGEVQDAMHEQLDNWVEDAYHSVRELDRSSVGGDDDDGDGGSATHE